MPVIDLNSDLGESFGAFTIGRDAELMPLITSANVACGFHGGDPRVLEKTVSACVAAGVAIGAHPGLPDLVGFGRRAMTVSSDELRTDVLYQLGALEGFCRAAGTRMRHVKPHGALTGMTEHTDGLAEAVVAAVIAFDRTLPLFAMPGSRLDVAARAAGLLIMREAYGDRSYTPAGELTNRRLPGALITDPGFAGKRIARLVLEHRVVTNQGNEIEIDPQTICVHSDTPGSVELMSAIRAELLAAGVDVRRDANS